MNTYMVSFDADKMMEPRRVYHKFVYGNSFDDASVSFHQVIDGLGYFNVKIISIAKYPTQSFDDIFVPSANRWRIWLTIRMGSNRELIGRSVCPFDYAHKSSAVKRARQLYDGMPGIEWIVSQTNPMEKG